ncbi:hypothetical protein CEXT_780341 [Caerostris extrusa]|uniref:Uncharacterized protein n=1 Tax=Caerostris extrusa TaxID=172846 RepID=A0AAV4RAS5_CAEEX|nr:hypothetical protein CEXT_780341 [Caerostris extrusa]
MLHFLLSVTTLSLRSCLADGTIKRLICHGVCQAPSLFTCFGCGCSCSCWPQLHAGVNVTQGVYQDLFLAYAGVERYQLPASYAASAAYTAAAAAASYAAAAAAAQPVASYAAVAG